MSFSSGNAYFSAKNLNVYGRNDGIKSFFTSAVADAPTTVAGDTVNITYNELGSFSESDFDAIANQTYTGSALEPAVTSSTLTEGTDYSVAYADNTDAGTATVTITGLSSTGEPGDEGYDYTMDYTGCSVTKTFNILPASQKMSGTKSYTKTAGAKFKLNVKSNASGAKLSYKSSSTKIATVSSSGKVTIKRPGKATITVVAKAGNYNDATFKVTINAKPKKVTLVKSKTKSKKKGQITVTWKKVTGATGYKVSYKVGKKTKTKTVKGYKHTKKVLKKLKKGKKYTVKVRAYTKSGGKTYYGAWSKAKKVKVKK
ncbi:MAG: Ig-like domain-containing protein [Coriobacteriales bacterium]